MQIFFFILLQLGEIYNAKRLRAKEAIAEDVQANS